MPLSVVPCRCNCTYCPTCSPSKGKKLLGRLISVLALFRKILLLTFTVDPSRFPDPSDAFDHVRRRKAVAETIKSLFRMHQLASQRYFATFEVHASGFPHWHVLVDAASFLDQTIVQTRWDRFGPHMDSQEQRLGHVDVSEHRRNPDSAAKYVLKTYFDPPTWPQWILAADRVPRYTTSRGFFPTRSAPPSPMTPPLIIRTRQRPTRTASQYRPTIADRLRGCGTSTIVLDHNSNQSRGRFYGKLESPFADIREQLGAQPELRRVPITLDQFDQLQAARIRSDV